MGPPTDRRRFLSVAVGAATVGLAGCSAPSSLDGTRSQAVPTESDTWPGTVTLEPVVEGLTAPLAVAFADDGERRYVAERGGRIVVHEGAGLLERPVLDLGDAVVLGGERGLLGTALHPNFETDRRLFVHYSAPRRPGTPTEFDHTGVLASFEVTDDGTRARRESERTILEFPQPQDYHNGGGLAFGPDGYLYVAVGAGGGGGGGGQDVTADHLGSVLRIDVDGDSDEAESGANAGVREGDRPYAIPEDNPLVGTEGLDEYYAWGFRNPWRLSFDGERCFVADVGEDDYEEVNLLERGGNYGWNVKEGTRCFRNRDCPDEAPDGDRAGDPLLDPIVAYPHEGSPTGVTGVSVIGGHVYRGSALPALEGAYVFGDFVANGRLFAAVEPGEGGDGTWPTTALEVAGEPTLERILSFGRDDAGEVYVLGGGTGGSGVYRVVPAG